MPEDNDMIPSQNYCVITPGDFSVFNHEVAQSALLEGEIILTIWNYSALDQDVRGDIRNTAIYQLQNQVFQTLNVKMLAGEDGEWIVCEPMRSKSMGEIVEQPDFWASLTLNYGIKFGYSLASNGQMNMMSMAPAFAAFSGPGFGGPIMGQQPTIKPMR